MSRITVAESWLDRNSALILRQEAAIARLRAENEKLRAELEAIKSPPDYGTQKIMNEQIHYAGLIAQKDREIARLRAENEKLRAALKPFADAVKDEYNWKYDINVDDFRAAAAALKETE